MTTRTNPDRGSIREQTDALIADLYDRALNGDTKASAEWFDQTQRLQSENLFDIQVNIVPYKVADPSLSNILQNADAKVVMDALKGLTMRMRIDRFKPKLLTMWENLLPEIHMWLEDMERPRDEVY